MPLNGFISLCGKNAKQIVSRDKGNPQYHKANNVSNSEVTHYQIDGKVIKTGDRCDYLLMNETSKTAYLIELKGSDLVKAASQLEATENALRSQLVEYQLQYRIVVSTTLIISKKPGNTGISRDIRTEFTTDLLLSD